MGFRPEGSNPCRGIRRYRRKGEGALPVRRRGSPSVRSTVCPCGTKAASSRGPPSSPSDGVPQERDPDTALRPSRRPGNRDCRRTDRAIGRSHHGHSQVREVVTELPPVAVGMRIATPSPFEELAVVALLIDTPFYPRSCSLQHLRLVYRSGPKRSNCIRIRARSSDRSSPRQATQASHPRRLLCP